MSCRTQHPTYADVICNQPANHTGDHSLIINGQEVSKWPHNPDTVPETPSKIPTVPPCDDSCSGLMQDEHCQLVGANGYICTQPKGHSGPHRACGMLQHDLLIWTTNPDIIYPQSAMLNLNKTFKMEQIQLRYKIPLFRLKSKTVSPD